MGTFSIWHWLIVLTIVMLVFGTKRLRNIGSDLGEAVRSFRQSVHSAEDAPSTPPLAASDPTVETQARESSQSRA